MKTKKANEFTRSFNKRRPPRILKELKSGRYYIRDGKSKIYINEFDRIRNKNQVINTIINQLPSQKRRRRNKKGKPSVSVKRGENERFNVFLPQIGQAQFPNKNSLDLFHNTLSELKAKVEKSEKEQKNNNMVTKYLLGRALQAKPEIKNVSSAPLVEPKKPASPKKEKPQLSEVAEIEAQIAKQQKRLNRANASMKTKEEAKKKISELEAMLGNNSSYPETPQQQPVEEKNSSLASIPLAELKLELNTSGSKKYKESLINQIKRLDPNISKNDLIGLTESELEDILVQLDNVDPKTPRKEDLLSNSPVKMGFGVGKKDTNSPLYDNELVSVLTPYRDFVGVIMRDQLKGLLKEMIKKGKERFGFIINTDHSGGKGEHWQAIFINTDRKDGSVEFYDSYGDNPSQDVEEELKKFADNFPWYLKFKVNKIKHQTDKSNKCGYHSANFLIDRFKGRSFKDATEWGSEDRAVGSAKQFRKFGFI